jgi:hypothetical protein
MARGRRRGEGLPTTQQTRAWRPYEVPSHLRQRRLQLALLIALSGGAYAATGGSLILGRGNSASSLTGVSNSKGVAFSFRSKTGSAPFTVNGNSVKVSSLNADKVDGLDSTQLRGQTGPAGPAGAVGPQGPQGLQGPAGANGADGDDGAQGPQGIQGPAGAGLLAVFGDGSDGAATFDGTTTPAGTTRSGSTYTLTRDVYYTTATLTNGVVIKANGYRIFCRTELNIAAGSTIHHDGKSPTGRDTAGAPNVGTLGGIGGEGEAGNGYHPGNGHTTTVDSPRALGGQGGASGAAGGGIGAAGGAILTTASVGSAHNLVQALSGLAADGGRFTGGSGGGGGGSSTQTAGAGGSGGGLLGIYVQSLINNGTIRAPGGNGADAQSGNAGGGGGGGGGAVILVYATKTGSGTVSVAGGSPGTGTGSGGTGEAGSAGNIYELVC